MFLIYGRRQARIKKYADHQQPCKSCKVFDQEVKVYRDYYHFFFIPVIPVGDKVVSIRCKNCGEPMRLDIVKKHYEEISQTPFYLFTGTILLIVLFCVLFYSNFATQKEKKAFIENPRVGDVYTVKIREHKKKVFYFLRIVRIVPDSVITYHSNLEYEHFVASMDERDFFVKNEELVFLKSDLKKMLSDNEINSVLRDYDENESFNRIK